MKNELYDWFWSNVKPDALENNQNEMSGVRSQIHGKKKDYIRVKLTYYLYI